MGLSATLAGRICADRPGRFSSAVRAERIKLNDKI